MGPAVVAVCQYMKHLLPTGDAYLNVVATLGLPEGQDLYYNRKGQVNIARRMGISEGRLAKRLLQLLVVVVVVVI